MTVELAAIILLTASFLGLTYEMRSARKQYDSSMAKLLDSYARLALSKDLSQYVSSDPNAPLVSLAMDERHPDDEDGDPLDLPFSLRGD